MDRIKIMEASVEKWNRIIAGKRSDGGIIDCPPCRIFYALVCFGCPIAEYTGKKFCKGSPYPDWYWHHIEEHDKIRRKVYCPECLRLATAMRDYMIEIVDHMKAERERKRDLKASSAADSPKPDAEEP